MTLLKLFKVAITCTILMGMQLAYGYTQDLQNTKVSLKLENATLKEIFDEITKVTNFNITYGASIAEDRENYDINCVEEVLSNVLIKLSNQASFIYLVQNQTIVIKRTYKTSPKPTNKVKVGGVVKDAMGVPLAGTSVSIKNTSRGTTTDFDGLYSIEVEPNDILVFSYLGFISQEIPFNGSSSLNVILLEDTSKLEEVVVVAYGTQKKVNLTGALSTISNKEITVRPIGQTSSALQGLSPGVTVVQNSGRPGGDTGTIRIRGIGTLSNSSPLVIIDGVEGSLNDLDPNLIDSISVLKDAASSSIYGSRAANGVVLVTTKRSKSQKLTVNYNHYTGVQTSTNLPNMVDALDHINLTNIAYVNMGREPLYTDELVQGYRTIGDSDIDSYPNTDWQNQVLVGSGIMSNHFLSVSGGGEKTKFQSSFGYFDQEGVIKNSSFERLIFRNNMDVEFSEKFKMQLDLQLSAETTIQPGRGTSEVFHWMNRIPANQPGINSNGSYGEGWNGANPIAFSNIGGQQKRSSYPKIQLNTFFNYKPIEQLIFTLNIAPRFNEYSNDVFYESVDTFQPDDTPAFTSPAITSLTRENSRGIYNNLRGSMKYNDSFKDHDVSLLLGISREDYRNEFTSAFRDGFIFSDYPVLNTGSADNQQNSGSATEWALQSFFGRVNYNYKDRYLLEINGRYDGSSRFSEGNKYGFFPSVSGGWRISEEHFMKPLDGVITQLKLRASWGRLGNQDIGNYPFTSSIAIASYAFDKQIVNTGALNTAANSNISWETTEMTNVGIDLGLFSKLTLTAEFYDKNTHDILYDLDIPLTIGLNRPYQNAGVVNNKGWEIGAIYRDAIGDFNFDININLSDVKNEVISLKGVNRTGLTVSREGSSINSIYGLEAEGFFQTEEEILTHATQFGTVAPGDLKYKDQNNDGIINDDDNVIIGSTIPRYTFGAILNATFKNFDFNMVWQGVGKADGFLYQQGIMPFFNGGTVQEQHKDYWTPENRDASFPRLTISHANNEKNSSFWVKDASYVRLKNLQIGYRLPKVLTNKLGIDNLRLYINGQNLVSIDDFWDGYDVEAPVGRGDVYPQVKVYSFGLNLNF
ncbi:SusC/RagA family TonB-linked outer membrane protein [Zobellia roscoffensis]|uniref:SusC/RagA family TonB-linked outer membrane protein n=1 Tax=Zobellia roscoffensis TaxID=2779508 RepID=UPI00188CDDED|nr:TonB-dependent receptor [Zobellia roscoffensis]